MNLFKNKKAPSPPPAGSPLRDPCEVVMGVFAYSTIYDLGVVHDALGKIIADHLWAKRQDLDRRPFASFADFALYRQPNGLGVTTERAAKILKRLLVDIEQIGVWFEILIRIARRPGRPTRTNGEDFRRFYVVSTGPNTVDRILLRLHCENETEVLERVCRGEITAHQAAKCLGWSKHHIPVDRARNDLKTRPPPTSESVEGMSGEAKTLLLKRVLASMDKVDRINFLRVSLENESLSAPDGELVPTDEPVTTGLSGDELTVGHEARRPDASPP